MSLVNRQRRPFWPTEELRNAADTFESAFPRDRMTQEQVNAVDGFMLVLRRELDIWRKAKRSANYSASSLKKYWDKKRAAQPDAGRVDQVEE